MNRVGRLRLLARMAKRYGTRHKAQTLRAILGLLVATAVLATGLGLGESIGVSLEEAALSRFGPIDVVVRGQGTFDASLTATLAQDPDVRPHDARGVPTVAITGTVVNPRADLAESFSTIRGVSPGEAAALGPLAAAGGGVAPEPDPGEAVIEARLAERLGARVGDTLVLHLPLPDALERPEIDIRNFTGVSNTAPPAGGPHVVSVGDNALGMGVRVTWLTGGAMSVEVTGPGGIAFANESATSPLELVLEPPLEEGQWSIRVAGERPTPYLLNAAVVYAPATLAAATTTMEVRVAALVADEGRAAITNRPTVLVPLAELQRATGTEGQATAAYYRVHGDARAAATAMEGALSAQARDEIRVDAVKLDGIETAREAGAEITGFLLGMGGFTLLAAILLAFTLFSALVEERRAELGIMRALGLTRGEVALAMTLEGALYAFAAALAGLLLGVGLLAAGMAFLGDAAVAEGGPAMALHLSPTTVLTAFLGGTLLPLATIGIASLRFARLDPARAIRGIPDDPKRNRRAGLVAGILLALFGGLLSLTQVGWLVGAPLALAGLATLLAAYRQPLLALLAAGGGIAHVAWTLYAWNTWPEDFGELDPIMTLARGALLALGISALAVSSAKAYLALSRLAGRRKGPQRGSFLAVKYLVSRRRPAGLTMGMISLVVVIVTVMGTLFSLFAQTIPEDVAGYQVIGETPLALAALPRPLPADLQRDVDAVELLPRHLDFREANLTREGKTTQWGPRQFLGVTPDYARDTTQELVRRAPQYATDRDAWSAIARGEAIALPSWMSDDPALAPGEKVTLVRGNVEREYVLAGGISRGSGFAYLAADDVRAMGFPLGTQMYVRVAEGADPSGVAHRLTATYAEDGLTFASVKEEAQRIASIAQALVLVFEAFLALGLFVGLAATGFLASRAVHERMRDIGTLRALGYEEKDVQRAFVLESTLTAGLGILIGVAAGLLVAHSIWWREIRDEGIAFQPPWLILALFTVAVIGLAALAARGPAKRAAALPPALAVRYVE